MTGGGSSTDPKDPTPSTPDGGTNTPGEMCIPGTPVCVDPGAILAGQLDQYAGRALIFIVGVGMILIAAWSLAR